MTSPGPSDATARLKTAADAAGSNRPQLAMALANSDLSHGEIKAVGGFAQAMGLSVAAQLAQDSGAKTNFSAQEKNQLAGAGVQVDDTEAKPDSRSWWEKRVDWVAGALSNTGNALMHNSVTDALFTGMNWVGNAAHMPFRMISDGLDGSNNDEVDAEMRRQGYDPTSTKSHLAFLFEHGESVYHDLSAARDTYGDANVELAQQIQADPEAFWAELQKKGGDEAKRITDLTNTKEFQAAYDAVDRRHISPGRDLARIITLGHENNPAFTVLSGALDAAYDWYTDPTLILGRAAHVAQGMDAITGATEASALRPSTMLAKGIDFVRGGSQRAGLSHMTDQAGVEALLTPETKVGRGWQRYLDDAADLRAARDSGDTAKQAGIYEAMQKRYGVLMDLLPEINGQRVIADAGATSGFRLDGMTTAHLTNAAKPITNLDQLANHLVSTNGLLRIRNGMAARETIVMPGKLSWWAERRAAADTHTSKVTQRWINYARPLDLIPNEADQALITASGGSFDAVAGIAQRQLLDKSGLRVLAGNARVARAKFERVNRRFMTQVPNVERLDLTDPSSAKVVENIARMYLNRGDAAKLASSYALATDLADKRAIVRGVLVQSFHASGLSRSEAGRNFMERFVADQAALEKQKYGYGDTSKILTDRGEIEAGLYPDQMSKTVILPSMREMNHLAAKHAVAGWAGSKGLAYVHGLTQSRGMDALIGRIKMGWITTAAGGLRNALDEVANFAAYGMGTDVLAARVAFTKATKDLRAERRAASKERLALIGSLGRQEADDRIASQLGQGLKSHEDATLALEGAQRAQAAIDDVGNKLKQRVTDAHVARAEAGTYRYRALSEFEDAKKAGLPEEQLAPLREKAQYWSDQRAAADDVVKQHEKAYANRDAEQDKVRQKFADRGTLSVDEATRQVERAKGELHQAQLLQTAISHSLPYFARKIGDTVNDVLIGSVLGKAMSVMGKDWAITGDRVKWANELVDREMGLVFSDGVFQAHHADTQLVNASDAQAMDYHRAGLMARQYSFRSNGWGEVETDGGAGLNAWAKTLQLRFADPNSPAQSWAQTVHALLRPEGVGKHGTVADFEATGEDLMHGTPRDFPEFVQDRGNGARGKKVYMTDQPGVAEKMSQPRGAWQTVGEDNIAPRVIKAKAYGKTIDLRTRRLPRDEHGNVIAQRDRAGKLKAEALTPQVPEDLAAALRAEGRWFPRPRGNDGADKSIHGHEYSQALIDWMRANGYGKALVDADQAAGFETHIVLPEMIKHGANDPVAAYKAATGPMSRDEWANVLDAATESVRRRLDDPEMRHFLASSEHFQWYKGEKIAKGDDAVLDLAKQDYAERVSTDLTQALGREGQLNKPLLDELVAGRVPDRSWLAQNIAPADRPTHAIGQLWAPYNPAMQPGQITRGMTGMMTKAYDKIVTDQINAISRNPLVTALYMRARENTKEYVEHLVDNGWDRQVAEDVGRRIAAQHAEVEAYKHIDNPNVSSQFSMTSRNMFAFVRAQEDWLKRWGRTIKDNPELIRKAQLLIHGGESVGFLEQDDQQQLHFVYPNSGLLLGAFGSLFGALGQPNGVRVPMQGELSSQLIYLNPSLDNPVGLTGTPLLSLPWKAIAHFLGPDHQLMSSSMDAVINGQLGAGRQWWEQMLPSWANRIIGGVFPTEDMGSKYGAAVQSQVANMKAAGMLEDPKYQTAEGQAQLLHALQVGIHNDLLTTALFGFFAPAAPTYEGAGSAKAGEGFQGNKADWSAHITGLRSLKDEARQVFARLPYEEAKAWWVKVHPNESVLAPIGPGSRTTVGANSANGASTIAAAEHMQHNPEFYKDYGGKGGVAAYFIPQGKAGTKNGEFSDVAYRAQLALGIRDYKSLDEYFTDIVTSNGMSEYFDMKKKYDADSAATASPQVKNQLDAEWAAQRDAFMAANPLVKEKLASYAGENARDGNTIQSLYRMVNDTSPTTLKALGPNRVGVMAMLAAKDDYESATAALANRRGSAAVRTRDAAKAAYAEQINQLAQQFPGLADLANGVFRPTS